jgi:glutaredoxin
MIRLRVYMRKDCCLCDEMKEVIRAAASRFEVMCEEIDVDAAEETRALYGEEVPVLFVNGRKAFKYRLTLRELEQRLERESRAKPLKGLIAGWRNRRKN